MSAHQSGNSPQNASHEENEEMLLLQGDDEDQASPELNDEELARVEEDLLRMDDDQQPTGDTAHANDEEDLGLDEDPMDEFDGIPDLAGEERSSMTPDDEQEDMGTEGEEEEEPDRKASDGSEEPEQFGDEEGMSRRSSRSTRPSQSASPLDDEMMDEEEEEREDFDEKKKDDAHPVLLAQSGDGTIHVGVEYQATIAESSETFKSSEREDEDRDTALWLPPPGGLDEDDLVEFCEEAMGIYMLSHDRALYILQNSGYDYKKALETIAVRKPVREEWSLDDSRLFRQAYALYGKNFHRIRQTMPHRSMSSIIQHYYSTKKQQDYKSLVDQKIDKIAFHPEDQAWRETPVEGKDGKVTDEVGKCENCRESVNRLFLIGDTKQCNTCMLYYKLMMRTRPVPKEELPEGGRRAKKQLGPEYMELVDDFVQLAEHMPEPDCDMSAKKSRASSIHMSVCVLQSRKTKVHEKMREIEHDMLRCRTRIVRVEQAIKAQKAELADKANFDRLRSFVEKPDADKGRVRMQYTWTDQEKIIAFHCFVRYGRDFDAVAEVVGTKTPDMVKSLYTELKDDIDKIIDEAEEEDAKAAALLDREAVLGTRKGNVEIVDLE